MQLKPTNILSTQWLFKKARHYFAFFMKNKCLLFKEIKTILKTAHNGKSKVRHLWNFTTKNYQKSMVDSVNGSTCSEKPKIEITQIGL